MKTGRSLPGREPDIIYVTREHLDRIKHVYLEGPADLVVEIVSPESAPETAGQVNRGGVREYWCWIPCVDRPSSMAWAQMVSITH